MKDETKLFIELEYSNYEYAESKDVNNFLSTHLLQDIGDKDSIEIIKYLIVNENIKTSEVEKILFFKPRLDNDFPDPEKLLMMGFVGIGYVTNLIFNSFQLLICVLLKDNRNIVLEYDSLSNNVKVVLKN